MFPSREAEIFWKFINRIQKSCSYSGIRKVHWDTVTHLMQTDPYALLNLRGSSGNIPGRLRCLAWPSSSQSRSLNSLLNQMFCFKHFNHLCLHNFSLFAKFQCWYKEMHNIVPYTNIYIWPVNLPLSILTIANKTVEAVGWQTSL